MTANPYTSPYLKPIRRPTIPKWSRIQRHCKTNHAFAYDNNVITVDTPSSRFYLAKNSDKFRLKSYLDWAWYSPKTLAAAIDNDDIEVYYTCQLNHQNSDPNIWGDWNEEQDLKSYYAARAGRASLI